MRGWGSGRGRNIFLEIKFSSFCKHQSALQKYEMNKQIKLKAEKY